MYTNASTTAANERGQIYALNGETDLNINAPQGSFRFATNNILRMRLNRTQNVTIGPFTNNNTSGYVGISGTSDFFTNTGSPGPFSRLHLVDQAVNPLAPNTYAQNYGYRPWMRNGVTFSGNSDVSYIGQRYDIDDNTDFVINWSDNPGGSPWGVDRLKFVFTSTFTGTAKGMGSTNGSEAMRLWPKDDDEVNVGVGDFSVAPAADPTERLHIRTGRLRIEQLPADPAASSLTKVLVVDDAASPSGERGVVKWRDISSLINCSWEVNSSSNILTAYGAGTCPPDKFRGVGIGQTLPKAKLEVYFDGTTGPATPSSTLDGMTCIRSTFARTTVGGNGYGLDATALTLAATSTGTMVGVRAKAQNGNYSYGVDASASTSTTGTATDLIAVNGIATANNNATRCIGVFGKGTGAQNSNSWAGWFEGLTFCSLGMWTASDEQLKTNIQELSGASALLARITPRTYEFNAEGFELLGDAGGQHIGLLANELAEIVPSAVKEVTSPEEVDSAGNVVRSAVRFKAVNYQELIPLLIASNNEQQARLDAQEQRMQQLEEQLAACCAAGSAAERRSAPQEGSPIKGIDLLKEGMNIAPNPFTDRTTVSYVVPNTGRIRLEVGTQEGRRVEVLREEKAQAGAFTYEWNTTGLVPGTYLVTLLLEDKVMVKKAVKVGQ